MYAKETDIVTVINSGVCYCLKKKKREQMQKKKKKKRRKMEKHNIMRENTILNSIGESLTTFQRCNAMIVTKAKVNGKKIFFCDWNYQKINKNKNLAVLCLLNHWKQLRNIDCHSRYLKITKRFGEKYWKWLPAVNKRLTDLVVECMKWNWT